MRHIRETAAAVKVSSRRRELGKESAAAAEEIMLRADRRVGELLREMKKRGERRSKTETLKRGPITQNLRTANLADER